MDPVAGQKYHPVKNNSWPVCLYRCKPQKFTNTAISTELSIGDLLLAYFFQLYCGLFVSVDGDVIYR